MADFATALASEAASFTYGERREVVVKEEAFAADATGVSVDLLGFV